MTRFSSDIVLGVGVAMMLATLLIALVMYLLQKQNRERRYDEYKHRAELEQIRKSFEDQIYKLTDRLVATDERWRDVNHLLMSGQRFTPTLERLPSSPHSDFLVRAGLTEPDTEIDKKLVFVLTPFHPDYEAAYERVAGVCRSIGLTCLRGDEEHVTGDILSHILRLIVKARLVIANADGRNPNVFYELGIAHALGKPTLIIAASQADLPFDVRSARIIFWREPEELQQRLRDELLKVFVAVG